MSRKNFSEKREAIFRTVCNTKCHPSAEWVYNRLRDEYPKLSLGTVYRNLSLFKESGLIRSVGTVQGEERFDADVSVHPHFICSKCGKVIDLDCIPANNNEIFRLIENYTGNKAEYQMQIFYGICYDCTLNSKFSEKDSD